MKIYTKLTTLLLSLLLIVTGTGILFTYQFSKNFFNKNLLNNLLEKTNTIEYILKNFSNLQYEHLQNILDTSHYRITLIKSDGTVIFESTKLPEELINLENHLHRKEIVDALKNGTGYSRRYSATIGKEMIYFAKAIQPPGNSSNLFSNTNIIRLAITTDEVELNMTWLRSRILQSIIIIFLFTSFIVVIASKYLTKPIMKMASVAEQISLGNLEHRIEVRSNDEIGKLANSLNKMIDKLNEDIVKLKKLELIRKQFLGNVSHELRTPIFSLQTAIETLLDGAVDDRSVNREFLEKALNNAKRIDQLLSDLIEISRIESGEMKMNMGYFNLKNFLNECIELSSDEANKNGLSLICIIPDENIFTYGDKERLYQVMENLISNAIKYTPSGGNIKVYTKSDSQSVEIFVEDNGIGIPEKHIDRIFERFYRVDEDRSRNVGGTGLGLAIVKHIVEAHNSKVNVKSQVGHGSVFSFKLKKKTA